MRPNRKSLGEVGVQLGQSTRVGRDPFSLQAALDKVKDLGYTHMAICFPDSNKVRVVSDPFGRGSELCYDDVTDRLVTPLKITPGHSLSFNEVAQMVPGTLNQVVTPRQKISWQLSTGANSVVVGYDPVS